MTLVVLEGQLANSTPQVGRVVSTWRTLPADALPRRRRFKRRIFSVRQRLGAQGLEQLVRDYEQGLSLKETAAKYGVAKETVLRLLHAHGVPTRPAGCGTTTAVPSDLG